MKNIIYQLMDNKRVNFDIETLKTITIYEVLYKLCLDFKNEMDFLREPHKIIDYLNYINIDKLKNNPTLDNMLEQLKPFGLELKINTEVDIETDLSILNKIDFSKDVTRGDYNSIFQKFMSIQQEIYNTSSNIMGENSTPNSITQILKGCLTVTQDETLLDPCFGTGLMAIDIGLKAKSIQGQELNQTTFILAKINAVISNKNCTVKFGDSLTNLQCSPSDVVVSNSPFGVKFNQEIDEDYLQWGVPSKNGGDFHFISLVLSNMKKRGAIVVPEGVLFRSGREGNIREGIIKDNIVDTVISLPANLFPTTNIATSIVLFNKNKTNSSILFIDAKDYFKKIRGGVEITENDIEKIVDIYKNTIEKDSISKIISLTELQENDYILTVNRYIQKVSQYENINLDQLASKVNNIELEIITLRDKTNNLVKSIKNY